MKMQRLLRLAVPVLLCERAAALAPSVLPSRVRASRIAMAETVAEPPAVFASSGVNTELKLQLLSLAAALDRGQSYNPTSSDAYKERMEVMNSVLRALIDRSPPLPSSLSEMDGEWELAFTNVAHGIFRSSPFFLAVQEAYTSAGAPDKAQPFFRLHQLQTCSWGISQIGRVSQTISAADGMLYSEFDTNLLSLTALPVIGFWKLLPTFGGCVITASTVAFEGGELAMEVQYTTSRPVPGLPGLPRFLGEWGRDLSKKIWAIKVPVNSIWRALPWNRGAPTCSVRLVYFDDDTRIVQDASGDLFVYTRPVAPRPISESDISPA